MITRDILIRIQQDIKKVRAVLGEGEEERENREVDEGDVAQANSLLHRIDGYIEGVLHADNDGQAAKRA